MIPNIGFSEIAIDGKSAVIVKNDYLRIPNVVLEAIVMEAMLVANHELNENDGIYKKIFAQASALSDIIGNCLLFLKNGSGTISLDTKTGEKIIIDLEVSVAAKQYLLNHDIKLIFIRLMVPNCKMVSLMKAAKKKHTKVYYEIPTYPFFVEQFRVSRKKYRAVVKIAAHIIFWPFVYHNCNYVVIIKSNSKVHMWKKMVEITNGIMTKNIVSKSYDRRFTEEQRRTFRMVAVGTLYPYHGYDRILAGMKECGEKIGNIDVEFHIVGTSYTIDKLKAEAEKIELKKIFFHGSKSTEDLNRMYEDYDVGLGCLALHRRNADIDTTLKIVEYYCRGIPVVTSGKMLEALRDYTIIVPDGDDPIEIGNIYHDWEKIDNEKLKTMSEQSKRIFDWKTIMEKLLTV